MKFTKMQGLGNDYVYINCFEETVENPAELARWVSDRNFGVGADGLILICPSQTADVRMRMFNSDGSESEMCGNGIRCVAKYAFDHKLAEPGTSFSVPGQRPCPHSLNIETGSGILKVGIIPDEEGIAESVCVNMGRPVLSPDEIPVNFEGERVVDEPYEYSGAQLRMTCVSMGNPHAVFFCDDLEGLELGKIGPFIETDPIFPRRTNVHFVKVNTPEEITMRTWERGSGITMACGTGACACLAASVLNGKSQRAVLCHLPGGDLELHWCEEDGNIYMTGAATEVYNGYLLG
ncbi:diaminopimelate epimerase [Sedimentisphaera salicampi]|uniref:Diaminopimelate epimerase n=1 Tax=Sedimentisphaera salicampi TaxID=1941349 RepID=A0A1W6LJF4_9BACT|nr:diaminopimelate epimerase [Sedimentisphaera salicampi]ARN55885.1 Diaminopimelate epimerase [Sedimentisphaera salicampi]OXU16076.1 Diaminopimelate epimerase [Sedimentisphaera salicampi]